MRAKSVCNVSARRPGFTRMSRISVLAASCLLAASAAAQEAVTYETGFDETGSGEERQASVGFNGAECGEECHAASLHCAGSQNVSFIFADIAAENAAAAITSEAKEFKVDIGGAAFSFSIRNVKYGGEMYDTWDVEGELRGDTAEFTAALSKAKEFKTTLGPQTVTLPVTADVEKWVKSCGK